VQFGNVVAVNKVLCDPLAFHRRAFSTRSARAAEILIACISVLRVIAARRIGGPTMATGR
jgi:hypothetical protein